MLGSVLTLLVASALTACGQSDGDASSTDTKKIKLMLDWKPGPTGSALYYGVGEGVFEKAGVDLDIEVPSDTSAPLKLVATNKLDLAMSYESDTLTGIEQGLSVQAVGAIYPGSISGILAMPDSGIDTVDDLKGKKIGYSGIPSYKAYLDQMLETAGLGSNDVELINVGFNDIAALYAKKVDALGDSFSSAQAINAKIRSGGKTPFFVHNVDLGVPKHSELVFVANSKRLKSDKNYADRVSTFLAAYEEARLAAVDAPEQAWTHVTEVSSSDPDYLKQAVAKSLEDMVTQSPGRAGGCMDTESWAAFADWMVHMKLLKAAPDVDEAVTNEYLGDLC